MRLWKVQVRPHAVLAVPLQRHQCQFKLRSKNLLDTTPGAENDDEDNENIVEEGVGDESSSGSDDSNGEFEDTVSDDEEVVNKYLLEKARNIKSNPEKKKGAGKELMKKPVFVLDPGTCDPELRTDLPRAAEVAVPGCIFILALWYIIV